MEVIAIGVVGVEAAEDGTAASVMVDAIVSRGAAKAIIDDELHRCTCEQPAGKIEKRAKHGSHATQMKLFVTSQNGLKLEL